MSDGDMERLCAAIASGRSSAYDIELLLVSGDFSVNSQLNEVCSNGYTPLSLACKLNRAGIVHLLLQRGATPNKPSVYYNKYPLHYACDHSDGNLDVVGMLLAVGAQPNIQDEDGNTPLHLACTESNVSVVKTLLEAGADVKLADIDDETPLVRACFAKSVELVDLLLKAGSDPNYPEGRPLEIVVRAPSLESLKLLIAAGGDVSRNTYLSFASEHNYLDMMKVLRNYGAEVNGTGRLGLTALHHACISQESTVDAVRLLLLWGSNPNLATSAGDTPLLFACQSFALEKVRLLLSYGADVNQADGAALSPLVAALTTRRPMRTDTSYLTLIQLLLAAGARLSAATLERLKVLIVYLQSSNSDKEELFQLLYQHTSAPSSLQGQCRAVIRNRLPSNKDMKLQTLPLPNSVMSFLQFSDVPGCGYTQ
ncbi:ankyrin repeat and SOCS box protein 5-like [Littorina saxatilis]|uniref:SOCS box domain-containing protein n=1 Tax=Littorina saxatilis TaxID=31220 RepID=A0AAN9B0J6_9CAEN